MKALNSAYIYDTKKKIGYIFNSEFRLYESIDKHYLINRSVNIIEDDIRPKLDSCPIDEIPIVPGKMLNCATLEIRDRTPDDFVTYALPPPNFERNELDIVHNIMTVLCGGSPIILKQTLLDFISGKGSPYFVVTGPGWTYLKDNLSQLGPLVEIGNSKLFTEIYVRKKMLEEVSAARIVLVDVGDKTIRQVNWDYITDRSFPIQYRGIVYKPDCPSGYILHDIPNGQTHILAASALLGWIISPDYRLRNIN